MTTGNTALADEPMPGGSVDKKMTGWMVFEMPRNQESVQRNAMLYEYNYLIYQFPS